MLYLIVGFKNSEHLSDEAMLGQVLYGFIQQGVVNFHEFLVRQVLYFKVTQVGKGKISIT